MSDLSYFTFRGLPSQRLKIMTNERNSILDFLIAMYIHKEAVEGQNVKISKCTKCSRRYQWQQAQCQRRKAFSRDPPLMVFVT